MSSFGSLFHFNKKNAPENSTEKCCDCPCTECPYSAIKIYRGSYSNIDNWPLAVVLSSEIHNVIESETNKDIEDLMASKTEKEKLDLLDQCLKHDKTRYGKCVYKMNNDVCDHQVVNFEFENSATATLTMIAFSKDLCTRKTKVYGTLGSLEFDASNHSDRIIHSDFVTKKTSVIECSDAVPVILSSAIDSKIDNNKSIKLSGHGGSDEWFKIFFIILKILFKIN